MKSRVALEKAKANTTQDIIIEVALENLFSGFTQEKRETFYRKHGRRPYARI